MKKNHLSICFLTLLVVCNLNAIAQLGDYTINGDGAKEDCRTYRLTYDVPSQSSAIWNNTPIDLRQNFDLKFSVLLGKKGDSKGADGIAFVLQPLSTSLGSSGGGMGYEGISPSIGITIDTYQNSDQGDPKFHHITIQSDGTVDHEVGADLSDPVKAIEGSNNITDNKYHDLRIKWNASTKILEGFVDGLLRVSAEVDIINGYFFGVPQCFWGFTGSTGAFSNTQKFREALEPRFHAVLGDCDYTKPVSFFDSTFSYSPIISYKWSFGDGTAISSDKNPKHTYSAPGIYDVKLVVVNSKGCTDSITSKVSIQSAKPPEALYTYSKKDFEVNFFGDSSNGVYKWIWDFGDRSSNSLLKDPVHTYLQKGEFTVTLTVFSNCGTSTTEFIVNVDGNAGNGGNTGIEFTSNPMKNISIYPMPFEKDLNIQFNRSVPNVISIDVYNLVGESVYASGEIKLKGSAIQLREEIFKKPGIYFIKIMVDEKIISYKIIKI